MGGAEGGSTAWAGGPHAQGGGELGPLPRERLARLLRPGWARTVSARRVAALFLLVCAGALFFYDAAGSDEAPVVVAAHDLAPGHILTAADVTVVRRAHGSVPPGAVVDSSDAIGHTVTGPVRGGEMLTDVRLLGARTAAAATGAADARLVPVRLSDPALTDLIRTGDTVDVLSASGRPPGQPGQAGAHATTVATDATVVMVSDGHERTDRGGRVLLLALPEKQADTVAAASLSGALTVTLH